MYGRRRPRRHHAGTGCQLGLKGSQLAKADSVVLGSGRAVQSREGARTRLLRCSLSCKGRETRTTGSGDHTRYDRGREKSEYSGRKGRAISWKPSRKRLCYLESEGDASCLRPARMLLEVRRALCVRNESRKMAKSETGILMRRVWDGFTSLAYDARRRCV